LLSPCLQFIQGSLFFATLRLWNPCQPASQLFIETDESPTWFLHSSIWSLWHAWCYCDGWVMFVMVVFGISWMNWYHLFDVVGCTWRGLVLSQLPLCHLWAQPVQWESRYLSWDVGAILWPVWAWMWVQLRIVPDKFSWVLLGILCVQCTFL
jgi:hypothetical protein